VRRYASISSCFVERLPSKPKVCITAVDESMGHNSAAALPPYAVSAPYDLQAERQLLDLANQARAEAGLAPLQIDEGLTRAARKHSALMASQKQLSHDLPGEPSLPQRLAATSTLQLSAEGENVGLAPSAAEVHRGFMHSPHHRENVLNPDYNVAGFAVVRNGNMIYVTEDFGQGLPRHSAQQTEDLVAGSVIHSRRDANLPELQRVDGKAAESTACAMAQADSLSTPALKARYIVSYTSLRPEVLPQGTARPIRDGGTRAFAVGACYAGTNTYPNGAYWVVLLFY
jgi:uncharacterized protein YkwD